MIEYLVKGNGFIRNIGWFKKDVTGINNEIKFSYNLERVVHTMCFIVGKEII
jgi:hypothetical protein